MYVCKNCPNSFKLVQNHPDCLILFKLIQTHINYSSVSNKGVHTLAAIFIDTVPLRFINYRHGLTWLTFKNHQNMQEMHMKKKPLLTVFNPIFQFGILCITNRHY